VLPIASKNKSAVCWCRGGATGCDGTLKRAHRFRDADGDGPSKVSGAGSLTAATSHVESVESSAANGLL